jgi:hypothetical protein
MSHRRNITRIKAVNNALTKLDTQVVFAGGATVSLYVDAAFKEAVRPTDDVDVVIELVAYKNYAAVEERLRVLGFGFWVLGFVNDIHSKVICRYVFQGIIVDIMPTNEKVLGFSNKWYASGFRKAIDHEIDKQHIVKIFPVAYFIAGKLEAFKDRGKNDGRTSTDFEDMVFVLNHRSKIWEELITADKPVKNYLQKEFRKLSDEPYLYEWISSHIDFIEQERVNIIIRRLQNFTGENKM